MHDAHKGHTLGPDLLRLDGAHRSPESEVVVIALQSRSKKNTYHLQKLGGGSADAIFLAT